MKNFFLYLLLMFSAEMTFAAGTCNAPRDSTVIYFGNGINTTNASAQASLNRLIRELGSEHNGQKLEYSLAYNQTGGIAIDLLQSEIQLGAQFNSQIMFWLNGRGLVPDKLAAWYQSYVMRTIVVVAEEVAEHAASYLTDILNGRKVVVVSHSQGNFYVNEARDLLARQLQGEKMASFAIFGVATPANNVGGARSPYLTNHRDFIQYVPNALPANWKLYRSDKTDAEDVGLIQAHLFNATYISNDFDIRPQLVSGIKTRIDNATKPQHSCRPYVAEVVSLVAGRYITSCGIRPNLRPINVLISGEGMTFALNGWVDLTDIRSNAVLSVNTNKVFYPVEFSAMGKDAVGTAFWDMNRQYHGPNGNLCSVEEETPATFIDAIPRLDITVASFLGNIYRMLPKGSCVYDNVKGTLNDKPIEFSVQGSTVRLGNNAWDLGGEAQTLAALYTDGKAGDSPPEFTDPVFYYFSSNGSTSLYIDYARNRQILRLLVAEKGKSVITCGFLHESGKSISTDTVNM